MAVVRNNVLQDITTDLIKRMEREQRTIVWYGGKALLGILNDCFHITGISGNISYVIVDRDEIEDYAVNYAWNIPLINEHISVDIRKSPILSHYHIELNQPRPVDTGIIDELGNNAIYVVCSKYSEEMLKILYEKGINTENILELSAEKVYVEISERRVSRLFEGMKSLGIDQIHNIELDILLEFCNFCEKNNLRYWLGGGTMLGAVRHNGFIPWDDDIDVFMPDEDYNRLIEIYKDSDRYELLNYFRNPDYPFFFSKLADRETLIWHYGYPMEYVMGIYIDIFPLVGFPDSAGLQNRQWEEEHLAMAEWYWYQDLVDLVGKDKMPVTPAKILNHMKPMRFDEADMIGPVSVILQKEWLSRKQDFADFIYKSFEKHQFRVPIGYDNHLRERYGDYMQLPPIEKRVFHGYPMYKRGEING